MLFMRQARRSLACLLVLLLGSWLTLRLTPAPPLIDRANTSKALFDAREELLSLGLTKDDKYRLHLPLKEISKELVDATLLYEDRRFYSHVGVDPIALVRSVVATALHPKNPVGGSTITMQLVRLRMGLETRSVTGKLRQIFWALVFERHYSKEQILEAYFTLAPYGGNIEGAGAASLVYYGKRAASLSPEEAISLAVLPQHPSRRIRPHGKDEWNNARLRLVTSWNEAHARSQVSEKASPLSALKTPTRAPHLFQRVSALYPDRDEYHTTLDRQLQDAAEEVLATSLAKFKLFGITNGTILITERPSSKVRAYVGSANYTDSTIAGYVNGIAAQRSPGSLLKPFVYGAALDQGRILPESMLKDIPIRLSAYKPENFERNFLGPIAASEALVRSRNIPALEVFRRLTPGSFFNLLKTAGVKNLISDEYYGIALVLGALGTSSEEIASLYGALSNRGTVHPLTFLEGEAPQSPPVQILSPESSYLVVDMLANNPPAIPGFAPRRLAWKTGTSYGSKDAWAAGVIGPYTVVVWLGNFDGTPNPNLVGRDFAGPILFSMAERLLLQGGMITLPNSIGLNLKRVEVCALSGSLPGASCPHRKESWFIPGVSPVNTCSLHQSMEVVPTSGLRVCPGEHGEKRVFEVWPSELIDLFSRAGLKRNIPPPYEPRCGLEFSSPHQVKIISPEKQLTYYLESHQPLQIELLASVPSDATSVAWFVNDEPIGEGPPGRSMFWEAKVGTFEIRAVDNSGRSSTVPITIVPAVQ